MTLCGGIDIVESISRLERKLVEQGICGFQGPLLRYLFHWSYGWDSGGYGEGQVHFWWGRVEEGEGGVSYIPNTPEDQYLIGCFFRSLCYYGGRHGGCHLRN